MWIVLYLVLGSPINSIGPFYEKPACQSVADQLTRGKVRARFAECINVDRLGERPAPPQPAPR